MASTPPRNHWWHVPLYVDVRGLTTRRMHATDGVTFEIDFDFDRPSSRRRDEPGSGRRRSSSSTASRLPSSTRRCTRGWPGSASMSRSARSRSACLRRLRFPPIGSTPPTTATRSSASGGSSTGRTQVFEEFAGWYCGKTSPVHLFWHSLDLALTRFGGRRAPARPDLDPVNQETYSHEVVSFGFWAGDQQVREPTYYSYTAPEPAGLRERPLHP